jgi:hypothetical protein
MRKHIILFFSALLFLFACNREEDTTGIIKKDVMIRLLTDIHIVDGSLVLQPNGDSLFKYGTGKFQYVLKQYHTDTAQVRKSMIYYTRHIDVMATMYDEITKRLQAKNDSMSKVVNKEMEHTRKDQAQSEEKIAKFKRDSILKKSQEDLKKLQLKLDEKKKHPQPVKKHKKKKKKAITANTTSQNK